MDRTTPVRRSLWLSFAELGLFIVLCLIQAIFVPAQQPQPFWLRFVVNFLAGYLALSVGVATTWYVVVTFYLMSSTIDFNRQLVDPFAYVSWEVSAENPKLKARNISTSEKVLEQVNEQAVWVVLVVSNTRTKPIDKINVVVRVRCESQSWTPKSYEVKFEQQRLGIELNHSVKIGIVDLSQVPRDVVLNMEIQSLNYRANDSTADQDKSNGEMNYSQQGLGMLVPGNIASITGPAGGVG